MLSWPARLIDQLLLRLTVRRAELRRRTLWPDAEDLRRLRAGEPPDVSLEDPGPPATVRFLDEDGGDGSDGAGGRFEFASSPPYGLPHDSMVHGELFPASQPSGAAVVLFPGAFTGLNPGLEERFYTRVAHAFAQAGITAAFLTPPCTRTAPRCGPAESASAAATTSCTATSSPTSAQSPRPAATCARR